MSHFNSHANSVKLYRCETSMVGMFLIYMLCLNKYSGDCSPMSRTGHVQRASAWNPSFPQSPSPRQKKNGETFEWPLYVGHFLCYLVWYHEACGACFYRWRKWGHVTGAELAVSSPSVHLQRIPLRLGPIPLGLLTYCFALPWSLKELRLFFLFFLKFRSVFLGRDRWNQSWEK